MLCLHLLLNPITENKILLRHTRAVSFDDTMVISTTLTDSTAARSSTLPQEDRTTKLFPHSKRVGGYLLGKTIGEGSFAKVKLGLHIVTGEKVSVVTNITVVERFQLSREINIYFII